LDNFPLALEEDIQRDVALLYKKYVVKSAFPEYIVHAYLMTLTGP
jgi:hypothetical protein